MYRSWKKTLVATSVAGALLCSGVIAYAATDATTSSDTSKPSIFQKFGRDHRGGFKGNDFARGFEGVAKIICIDEATLKAELQSGKSLAEIAQAKGIAKEDLIAKMVAAAQTRLDEAVSNGKLTAEEAAQKKEIMKQHIEAAVDKKHTGNFGDKAGQKFGDMGKAGFHGFGGPNLQKIADLLQMTQDELKTELKSGKSLAEIAQTKGVAKADLVAKTVEGAQARLDEAVSNGKLTAEKAAQLKETMKQHIETFVDMKRGDKGKGGFHAPGGVNPFQQVADVLQMTQDELKAELKAGKSLEEIAQAKGVAKEDLKAKLLETANANIDKAVADGKLTAEKADQFKANLEKRIDNMLSHKGFGGHSRNK
ncbi:DUF2680 domain-containing protein [Heliobacterium gestii]|uniref:DUF2680 domain-containing protein n=1 Tax=Heliomicrobium gestii TaxID=2699 RepID=A0A845L5I7_HELGE|nr:DUF2680 domain-containing protein [Heliomicrobium gestii]MBM7865622.1 transposase-like protein [Heliomicrobium gestii]MZP41872.1 DUF2680 domain-containing protein [Heliomicrobium gestii]